MGRRSGRSAVRRVEFHPTKYGRELLFDAAFLRRLPHFDFSDRAQVLTFYDVTLATRGRGVLEIDGTSYPVRPGMVYFSRPGDVRRFRVRGLDGACFFFTAAFVREAFADARFLHRFRFLRPDRAQAALALTRAERRLFLDLFKRMEAEIRALTGDASEALRALLYEMLVRLDRFCARREAKDGMPRRRPPVVDRFLDLVERDFARGQRLRDYASELRVTPGHLSALCRAALGRSAGACVRDRLALEARRLLRYSGQGAAEVAYALGFEDPAYFSRFVKRETGLLPSDLARTRDASPRGGAPTERRAVPARPRRRPGSGRRSRSAG